MLYTLYCNLLCKRSHKMLFSIFTESVIGNFLPTPAPQKSLPSRYIVTDSYSHFVPSSSSNDEVRFQPVGPSFNPSSFTSSFSPIPLPLKNPTPTTLPSTTIPSEDKVTILENSVNHILPQNGPDTFSLNTMKLSDVKPKKLALNISPNKRRKLNQVTSTTTKRIKRPLRTTTPFTTTRRPTTPTSASSTTLTTSSTTTSTMTKSKGKQASLILIRNVLC